MRQRLEYQNWDSSSWCILSWAKNFLKTFAEIHETEEISFPTSLDPISTRKYFEAFVGSWRVRAASFTRESALLIYSALIDNTLVVALEWLKIDLLLRKLQPILEQASSVVFGKFPFSKASSQIHNYGKQKLRFQGWFCHRASEWIQTCNFACLEFFHVQILCLCLRQNLWLWKREAKILLSLPSKNSVFCAENSLSLLHLKLEYKK